ncbi:hypothetical protein P886_2304 [Alteromonadaceae bacterium 2753L.S.0a.02]|nr:hypothetical protein P886_2304 [Alteromonadaceae bacterium 2753L.S.0a.02]
MFASLNRARCAEDRPTRQETAKRQLPNLPESQLLREQKKQVLKILRYISEDLKIFKPRVALPSPWIIRSLIDGVYLARGNLAFDERHEWEKRINHFLCELNALTRAPHAGEHWFREPDGITPLFPNCEQFSSKSASEFAHAAREHLRDAHVYLI